jgi:hypothetical protein
MCAFPGGFPAASAGSAAGWGEQTAERLVLEWPAGRRQPDHRAGHAEDDALDYLDAEDAADRHAEGEHRRVLASALVGRDARGVEGDEEREQQRHALDEREDAQELLCPSSSTRTAVRDDASFLARCPPVSQSSSPHSEW